jgi:hypothetical protein
MLGQTEGDIGSNMTCTDNGMDDVVQNAVKAFLEKRTKSK